jgi:predicted CXXCH cytochrome family protein
MARYDRDAPRRGHCLLWAFAASGLVLAASMQGGAKDGSDTAQVKVIFPADQCVVESGKFDLLCLTPKTEAGLPPRPQLRVDGKPGRWEPYEAPTLLSRLELSAGRHEIAIGPKILRIHVPGTPGAAEEPLGWPVYRSHLGATEGWKDCATCHEVAKGDNGTVVGNPREPSACSQCHPSVDFELTHFHLEEPLASCHTCHALHGSSSPSLLRAPVKKLCAECHD